MLTVSLVTHTNERKREAHRQEQHTQEVRRTAWGETASPTSTKSAACSPPSPLGCARPQPQPSTSTSGRGRSALGNTRTGGGGRTLRWLMPLMEDRVVVLIKRNRCKSRACKCPARFFDLMLTDPKTFHCWREFRPRGSAPQRELARNVPPPSLLRPAWALVASDRPAHHPWAASGRVYGCSDACASRHPQP